MFGTWDGLVDAAGDLVAVTKERDELREKLDQLRGQYAAVCALGTGAVCTNAENELLRIQLRRAMKVVECAREHANCCLDIDRAVHEFDGKEW